MVRSVVVALASLVAAISLAPTASAVSAMSTEALVVLAALATSTALMAVHGPAAVPDATLRSLRPRRRAVDVPLVLAGRTTDVGHHPVRPRAPGLV
ncbi:hypothetical protein HN031_12305 [Nocardioides sp. zg-1308]|uniref:Secreted protein n=1 Tax=Nocardioides renjunii TaxID=3095075 RepID=A0ABU5KD34_9ACTN|nr:MULTISPECIES: hypothetical protein [unclassified Nocardioides]MDZ5662866.1 hypothetical protein [Nocardioides sp. S-58]NPD05466.1 hypothetical protein [Nocardioides sp. zg-1308]WQQ23353.1 hypothetical protein SHK17_05075 [Nocardioides sp. S-34]